MSTNYSAVMQDQITQILNERTVVDEEERDKNALPFNKKPTLLLHACCAPCSSSVVEKLVDVFNITLFFYNPNIYPHAEYSRRLSELNRFLHDFMPANKCAVKSLSFCDTPYTPEEFYDQTNVRAEIELQTEHEQGERCRRCYSLRMQKSFDYASAHSFDFMTTTLSLSSHKNSAMINAIGSVLKAKDKQSGAGTQFLFADFKKLGGEKRSLELSKQYNLYRQNYCGCEYSLRNTQKK
jgi:predicted adenine nucleotide alpha hydrolase (AANH) superfamily ATPase